MIPRVGFVGAGSVLWAYLQVLDRLVPRGLASEGPICARRKETWPSILARRPGARLVADVREVVESDVDVVVVITPPASHAEVAALAIEHGKHVVVEKPIAGSRSDAESLVRLAAERGVLLLAAPFVQLAPTFRALWTAVSGGAIGHVHSARGLYGNAGATWASWYHDSGVGPLAEMGIYNLKSLTALLGPVAEVVAAEATAVEYREAGGREIRESRSGCVARDPAPPRRRPFDRGLEPGNPALPSARPRALRNRRNREPPRRRLGSARLRALAKRDGALGE